MRVALLSNVTVDLLAGMLKKTEEVYLSAGFDTWQQEIMINTSGLYEFHPDAVVILIYANAYTEVWNEIENGKNLINEWAAVIKMLSENLPSIPIFVSSIDISNIKCRYGSEIRYEAFFENLLTENIEKLYATTHNIYVLPVKDIVTDLGRNAFYAPKMWYMGSMPYSIKGMSALNELILNYISSVKGMKKKCIAVDLDNTLWGGVIGEDGVSGIKLSNNKEGSIYKDAQKLLKKMKEQGVMLAILSKNNIEDVEPVFEHPDMVLKHEDFVAEIIDWNPKSSNIKQLAQRLNIGLDSFVFIDDNPAEREQMKAECPEVTVIDFPKDTSQLPQIIAKLYDDCFLSMNITGEDSKKTEMYRSEAMRNAERSVSVSIDDFLKKLEMTMDIHIIKPDEEERVVQLINKTNQFNVTTKRYSAEEVQRYINDNSSDIFTVKMADKYGEQGLVAVVILTYANNIADIDTFLMSCRVMGRNAENEIMARLKEYLKNRGVEKVTAKYVKTAKNTPVSELFDKLGFTYIPKGISSDENTKHYEADVEMLPDVTDIFGKGNIEL